jgi:amino acid transporter
LICTYHLKLEFSLKRPKFLATCMYGIPFILLGNLAGNALALGRYVMLAAGYSDAAGKLTASRGSVIGIAIGALTLVILLHMSSRRGGIILNNAFAIFKVLLLLAIIVIGFAFRGDSWPQKYHLGGQNYAPKTSFADRTKAFSSYTQSLLVVMYSYSGYEQPFYVSD